MRIEGEVGFLTTAQLVECGAECLNAQYEQLDPDLGLVLVSRWVPFGIEADPVELFECDHGGMDSHWHILRRST